MGGSAVTVVGTGGIGNRAAGAGATTSFIGARSLFWLSSVMWSISAFSPSLDNAGIILLLAPSSKMTSQER